MSSIIGPVTDTFINNVIIEVKKKENKEKIMKYIIDPFLSDLSTRYYPYILTLLITMIIIVILLIFILVINMTSYNSKN